MEDKKRKKSWFKWWYLAVAFVLFFVYKKLKANSVVGNTNREPVINTNREAVYINANTETVLSGVVTVKPGTFYYQEVGKFTHEIGLGVGVFRVEGIYSGKKCLRVIHDLGYSDYDVKFFVPEGKHDYQYYAMEKTENSFVVYFSYPNNEYWFMVFGFQVLKK